MQHGSPHLHVLEQGAEEGPVVLLLEGDAAAGLAPLEGGVQGHLQRIQAALQQLIRLLVLPSCPAAPGMTQYE